jgi:hypothetical protein
MMTEIIGEFPAGSPTKGICPASTTLSALPGMMHVGMMR